MYEKLAKKCYGSYYISESLPVSRTNSLHKKRSSESAGQNGQLLKDRNKTTATARSQSPPQKIAAIRLCFLKHDLDLCYFQ